MTMQLRSGLLKGVRLYMVGIKGTGMAALAELFAGAGAEISGSDLSEEFYTDAILRKNAIPCHQGFDAANLPENPDLVIYSSAYDPATHPELLKARSLGYKSLNYSTALAQYAHSLPFAAVAGVHGKTSTTSMLALLVKKLGLNGQVLAGSALSNLGGSSTYNGGNDFFVAETCEYRRHFLKFSPHYLLITNVEADHLDYFKDEDDIRSAFEELLGQLPHDGTLLYCFDDPGARRVAANRPEIRQISYGFNASGDYGISAQGIKDGFQHFTLKGFNISFKLPYPGTHSLLNATAALALLACISGHLGDKGFHQQMAVALAHYSGASRRTEYVADIHGIKIIDDYAHHPTAIQTTLAGYRSFFPERRLVVDFMSHTYSRTFALLKDFASCFHHADILILNDIYASAREDNNEGITGETLYNEARKVHPCVHYIPNFEEAASFARATLAKNDIFVTMGAGDNWKIGRRVVELFGSSE